MAKPKLWLGLSTVGILVTTLLLAGRQLAEVNAGLINDVLGLSSQKISTIDSAEIEGSAYKDANGALTNKGWKKMIAESYNWCEEAVEQGAALLKNEVRDGKPTLPLAKEERHVTLLGRGSRNLFMRSGAGGAAPNTNLVVSLDKAFERNGFSINRDVFDGYSELTLKQMTTPSTNVEAFSETKAEKFSAEYGDAAIITFVRIGTENTDPSAGQLDLKTDEDKLLKLAKEYKDNGTFKKIIVLINSPLPMSMDWVDKEEYGIDALVYAGVPGYYGAGGIPHVLAGEKPHMIYDEVAEKMVAQTNNGEVVMEVINPSGHLVDTFAASASSSAAYQNFGDSGCVVYKEGVYVGYKYYETRYEDAVLGQGNANGTKGVYKSTSNWNYADEMGYPFGYGLSYVDFEQKITDLKYNANDDTITATVEVENKGDMNGKASVQLYVQQPYTQFDKDNGLGRPSIALMGYDKIDVPAKSKRSTTVTFDRYFLATYDYKVNKSYFLEGGDYYFAVGNGAHEALNNIISVAHPEKSGDLVDHLGKAYSGKSAAVKKLAIAEDALKYRTSHYSDKQVTNQFDDADYNWMAEKNNKTKITYLDRQDWEGTWPTKTNTKPTTNSDTNMSQYYKKDADCPKYTDGDGTEYNVVYKDANGNDSEILFTEMNKVPLEGIVEEGRFKGQEGADVWDAFIKQMTLDDLSIAVSDNRGIRGVKKIQFQGGGVKEGPEGLLDKYKYGDLRWATGFPTGPTYTGTWDHNMQAQFGAFFGEDALFCGVPSVNASGANINRTPYGSRASEYMSEDGILNYNTAGNIIGAARKKGLIMNIKHCFLNNQESGRQGVQTWCNEQAIREIYLRPFEGALTKGHGLGIMTSYNRIGARYAATHEPLMMNVMRGEWNYKGFIIDDALTGSNTSDYSNGPAMVHCGTDLFCLDGNRGSQLKQWVTSNNDGQILKDMQRANKYVLYSMSRSWMGGVAAENVGQDPWWKITINALTISAGVATAGLLGMYIFTEFFAKKKDESLAPEAQQEVTKMEKVLNFFKNKAVGYFLVAANVVLALILALIFLATYKGAMANNASAYVPETIAIFLFAGAIIEVVVLILPQYRFVHIAAIVMFALALFKEVFLIPNLIADWVNNVFYQGGDLGTNVFYLVMLIAILTLAIAAAFVGFYKSEEEAASEMPIKKDNPGQIAKIVCGCLVVVAAIVSSSLIAADMQRKINIANANQGEGFNPITEEIKKKASEYAYDFKPNEVLIKEQEGEYNYSGINSKVNDTNKAIGDQQLVYVFEGAYAEGYQGDYSETYANLYLWNDGYFGGKVGSTSVRGYWFNSSLAEGKDAEGKDIKDCLKMVSNVSNYDSIIAQEATGFYQYQIYVYLGFSWGTRSMGLGGYEYYPEVAIAIDPTGAGSNFAVGDTFDKDALKTLRVLKNLNYAAVFKSSEVTWTIPSDMMDKNNVLLKAGEFEIKASWNNMEATVKVNVAEAPAA